MYSITCIKCGIAKEYESREEAMQKEWYESRGRVNQKELIIKLCPEHNTSQALSDILADFIQEARQAPNQECQECSFQEVCNSSPVEAGIHCPSFYQDAT